MTDSQPKNNLSVRQLSRLLKKYNIRNGDILALRHQSENANLDAIDMITKALTSMQVNALVIVVDDFNDLSVLDELEMNKRGWYRIEKLMRIIKTPPIKDTKQ